MITRNSININDITAIVATHKRKYALQQMVYSFKKFYPNINIVIADSSPDAHPIENTNYITLPPDTGISQQRNIALSKVQSDLFLLLDDDFVCTESTNLLKMADQIINNIFDLFGGKVNNINTEDFLFHGDYEIMDETLYHRVNPFKNTQQFDTIHNFFIAETIKIKEVGGWDNTLKFAKEHDDFFLNLKEKKIKIGYNSISEIDHYSYKKYHGGDIGMSSVEHFLKKWNLKNKIEIRLIDRGNPYISYHNVIQPTLIINQYIQNKIYELYGNYPIKIT